MDKQGIKANITANMDDLNKGLKSSSKSAREYERDIKKLNKELNHVGALKKRLNALKELEKKQRDGKDLSKDEVSELKRLKRETASLTLQLDKQGVATDDLNKTTEHLTRSLKNSTNQFARQRKEIGKTIKETKELSKANLNLSKGSGGKGGKLGGAVGAMRGGLSAAAGLARAHPVALAATMTIGAAYKGAQALGERNEQTAEQSRRARQMGYSPVMLKAMTNATKGFDVTADNILDLPEELGNKLGDWIKEGGFGKEDSDMSLNMKALNLTMKELSGKSKGEVNDLIMNRLLKMGNSTQAASVADHIYGGEANKIITALYQKGYDSLAAVGEGFEQVNSLTEAATQGAEAYMSAMTQWQQSGSSILDEFAGRFGAAFSEYISGAGESLTKVFNENRVGLTVLADIFGQVIGGVTFVASKLLNGVLWIGGRIGDLIAWVQDIFSSFGVEWSNSAKKSAANGRPVQLEESAFYNANGTPKSDTQRAQERIDAYNAKARKQFEGNVGTAPKTPAFTMAQLNGVQSAQKQAEAAKANLKASKRNTHAVKRLTRAQEESIKLETERKSEMYANSAIASAYEGRAAAMTNNFSMSNSVSLPDVVEKIASAGMDHIKQGLESLNLSNLDSNIKLI